MEQVANLPTIVCPDAEFFPHFLVVQFRQRFSAFNAKAMQVKVLGVLSTFEQALRLGACLGTDSDQRQSDDIHLAGGLGSEEISDAEAAAFLLPRKGKAQDL